MKIGKYVLHGHINKWWKFHSDQLIISRYFKFLFTVTRLSPAFHFRENPLEKCDKSNDRPGGRVTEAKNFPVPRTFFERKKKEERANHQRRGNPRRRRIARCAVHAKGVRRYRAHKFGSGDFFFQLEKKYFKFFFFFPPKIVFWNETFQGKYPNIWRDLSCSRAWRFIDRRLCSSFHKLMNSGAA